MEKEADMFASYYLAPYEALKECKNQIDNDCVSSFLWVKEENLLLKLYPGRIVLPHEVFD
ncbi:M78 family metallopeptidase domain-containing protein [Candidatus Contubernalis alkaliaceticus]|uniref:hypothetical protein n=1 Tax=Candidatus Contubernalis alkaliaceticus TaxID=338645 RepID=UPI001F4C39E8|nr:hypothetical protein [Candidatus Contubernalis alkalaceticus]UNC91241.1 hypothetical protein HUE98_03540 [Candidatus Contubernalis alkalaceticus]